MHGHPFPGLTQLWWGVHGLAERRPRNLFAATNSIPDAARMFRAGGRDGLIDAAGRIPDRAALHHLMKCLAERLRAEVRPGDNPAVPAGYTYLLQFMAHDLVDSVTSFDIEDGVLGPDTRNQRTEPLYLDTLYGPGPDECPQAYTYGRKVLGPVPRTRLRIGPRVGTPPAGLRYCPYRDVARALPNSADEGFGCRHPALVEAMVADPRNDQHALISQFTLLLQLLHNHILSVIEGQLPPAESVLPRRESAYRAFNCARLAVTLIYRNIILKDVLRRILDPRIFKRYITDGQQPFDTAEGIPLEFTFGAFRFGHTLVRDHYNVNTDVTQFPVSAALQLSSLEARAPLPIDRRWYVDWARFFFEPAAPAGGMKRNFSKRIGPHYPQALKDEIAFPPGAPGFDAGGLPHLDFLSSCYAGVLSVPTLCRELRDRGFNEVDSFEVWRQPIADWLTSGTSTSFTPASPLTRRIADDPPLSFFVLFEAARIGRPTSPGAPEPGQQLGPVGSIIVAETILGALRRHTLGVEKEPTLKARLRKGATLFFEEQPAVAEALSAVDEIESMPGLLDYMGRQNLFAAA